VSTDDVQRYVDALASTPSKDISLPYHLVTMNEVRKIIARRMTESAQTIPQFSVTTEVEMDAFKRALQAVQPSPGSWPNRISITALLIYLIARALAEHPLVNAHYAPEGILVFDTINLAVAVSTERGLVAPVIHHVENLALAGLAGQLVELVQRSKEGSLVLDDLTAGTFTMSNLGMYGVTQFIPLVNPPQAAILGVGAIQPTLVPLAEGRTRQVSRMSLSLSADHRVLDGSEAAGFLATLKIVIEQCTPAEINI
jgi:pyruvate dehydrogenase E2 component (dihydrolipoamide acetyltransferase)